MNNEIIQLGYAHLAIAIIPAVISLFILICWSLNAGHALYAMARMLIQLLCIGYFLVYLFATENPWLVLITLFIMILASSWIALGVVKHKRSQWFLKTFWAISLGGGCTLILIIHWVLDLTPWFSPQYVIPIAGMIFASCMNSVSLSAERITAEMSRQVPYNQAKAIALNAALIPVVNMLLAVGLVSLPGMMTGQILSGISPLIAVRYQIMVMSMIFGSTCIASACFLRFIKKDFES